MSVIRCSYYPHRGSYGRASHRCASNGHVSYVMGVHLIGVYLTGMCLIGVLITVRKGTYL
jgi:hypothetical protein